MKVEITYPSKNARRLSRRDIITRAKWPFAFAAYICPIVNLAVGGKAWSVIVLWSLWIVWSFTLSPDMVEINRISLFVKLTANASVLLFLIDLLLSPGWAVEVVPIVCFSGLIVSGALFFTDISRQKQNMLPMLLLTVTAIILAAVGLIIWRRREGTWALAVMGAFALALLIAEAATLGGDFIREIKKRFHTG